jgi:hypothetical protein
MFQMIATSALNFLGEIPLIKLVRRQEPMKCISQEQRDTTRHVLMCHAAKPLLFPQHEWPPGLSLHHAC